MPEICNSVHCAAAAYSVNHAIEIWHTALTLLLDIAVQGYSVWDILIALSPEDSPFGLRFGSDRGQSCFQWPDGLIQPAHTVLGTPTT